MDVVEVVVRGVRGTLCAPRQQMMRVTLEVPTGKSAGTLPRIRTRLSNVQVHNILRRRSLCELVRLVRVRLDAFRGGVGGGSHGSRVARSVPGKSKAPGLCGGLSRTNNVIILQRFFSRT